MQGNKRGLVHLLPLLLSLKTRVIIESLSYVKKSEWAIDGTLHGSRNDWSDTRHVQSCVLLHP